MLARPLSQAYSPLATTTLDSPHLFPISYHTTVLSDSADIPVDLRNLEWNIRKCKALTAMSCVLGLLLNGITVWYTQTFKKDEMAWTYVEIGLQAATLVCLSASVFFAPSILLQEDGLSKFGKRSLPSAALSHRSICIINAILTMLSLWISLVRLYLCNLLSKTLPLPLHAILVILVVVLNLCAFISAGYMRRGPKLYHRVPSMQLGSGLRATEVDVSEEVRLWLDGEDGGMEPEANVLDYDGCGVLPLTFAGYIVPIWRKSWSKPKLEESDLPQIPYKNRAQAVSQENEKATILNLKETGARHDGLCESTPEDMFTPWGLLYHLWKGNSGFLVYGALLTALATFLEFFPKLLDREIIILFENGGIKTSEGKQWGYLMCIGGTALRIAGFVTSNYTDFLENYQLHGRIQMKLQQMLVGKLMRGYDPKYVLDEQRPYIHEHSAQERKLQLATLFGNDLHQISSFASYICFDSVKALIGFGVPFIFLGNLLGWAAFASLLVVLVLTPMVKYLSRSVFRMSRKIPFERDKRVSVIRELLSSIKAIKLNAWEEPFVRRAAAAREQELKAIQTLKLAEAVLQVLDRWIPLLVIWLAYALHTVIRGKPFPVSTALITQKIFGGAIQALLRGPKILNRGFSLHVSCERVSAYLNGPELRSQRALSDTVLLRDVTAVWQSGSDQELRGNIFKLDRVTITFVPDSLNIIAGPLGSGKTLMLLSLLGETRILGGEIEAPRSTPDTVPGLGYMNSMADAATKASWLQASMAYVPQVAYIEHGTVRANILFGERFWEERYILVTQACALEEDFVSWPDGDMTEVGAGGYVLSGGQQSRINLARALYSRAKIILLDDPLSAVDRKTSHHLILNAICGSLVRSRTVILTTHQISLCAPYASQVILLKAGRIEETLDSTRIGTSTWDKSSSSISKKDAKDKDDSLEVSVNPASSKTPRQLIKAEERVAGLSGRKYLISLLRSAGSQGYWTFLVALVIFSEGLGIYHTAWLAQWSSNSRYSNIVYALVSLTLTVLRGFIMFSISWLIILAFTWRASATVHQTLLHALLHAPLQTLHTIPTGRFLNRFTTDIQQFDMQLGGVVQKTLKMSFCIMGMLTSVVIQVPALGLVVLALIPILFSLQSRLSKFLSDAKKINSIWKSPLLTMVNDFERAVSVIRAFGAVDATATRMKLLQTQQRIAGLTEFAAWLLCRLCIQPVAILIPTTTSILVLQQATRSAAWAGFTLSIVQFVTQAVYDLIMQVGEIDIALVTVERIEQYSRLKPESDTAFPLAVSSSWPNEGHIQVTDLTARYEDDLPDVLHNVTFEVVSAERLGIVGRTGHGKSTLALCLLRAIQHIRGSILIDGVDISRLSLKDLRSRVCMIPQEAVLTSGTLRQALDINGEHSDADLYRVLRCVHLLNEDNILGDTPGRFADLEQVVTVGGENISRGERQLLALARALLKRSKLLIMDEATSSVDQAQVRAKLL